jgi:FixJ family two-component response regulator
MIQEGASPQSEIQRQGAPIIYLVDNDPSFLRALPRRLRTADYRVETFGSAEQFLTRRRSDAAGCAVLDLQMPGPGGLTTFSWQILTSQGVHRMMRSSKLKEKTRFSRVSGS